MANTIRHDIPVREYGIRVFINTPNPIDLTVECDETEIGNKAREYADDIIADVTEQILKQLKEISVGNGIAVIDKRDVGWDKQ